MSTYRDRREAENAASAYAWARQDAINGPIDTDKADQFARAYGAMWQTYRDERAYYMTTMRRAYENWLAHGHPYQAGECGGCGRRYTPQPGQPERCDKHTNTATISGGAT